MLHRRYRPQDNPAWPGLVDLFAFTLVIFIALNAGGSSVEKATEFDQMSPKEKLEQWKILKGQITRLNSDLQQSRHLVDELQAAKNRLRDNSKSQLQTIANLNKDIAKLGGSLDERDEENSVLQQRADNASKGLRQEARQRAAHLRSVLQVALGEQWGTLDPVDDTLPEFEIKEFRGRPVEFRSGDHMLKDDQINDVLALRRALADVLTGFPDAQVEVSGTADPDPLNGKYQIRDNIDLSAMRAATVAKLLKSEVASGAAPISNQVLIIGLGETGQEIEGNDTARRKAEYRKYRTVKLTVRIPIGTVAAER